MYTLYGCVLFFNLYIFLCVYRKTNMMVAMRAAAAMQAGRGHEKVKCRPARHSSGSWYTHDLKGEEEDEQDQNMTLSLSLFI